MPNVRDMADPDSPNYDKSGHAKLSRRTGVPIDGKRCDDKGGCLDWLVGLVMVLTAGVLASAGGRR